MSTTIDSLNIEIQSNSTNAAAGIRDLAKSLGELKKNGTISVAVKNLNNLSSALRSFSTMPSPASKIGALASSLQALKNVGSVAGIANSIAKLSAAMKAAGSMDTAGMDTKMANIAGALGQLSGVKASGFTSMVNALGRIGKVTESLNDEAIGKFADKVRILNEKLEPLSTKMTTIQAGLRGINANARSASGGVKKLGNDVNTTSLNMASMITVVQGLVAALQPVIRLLTEAIGQAIEWDGIAARFGRGFGASAEETYAWIQRLNEEMGINVQQFMQYSSVYATMLTGFGVAMEDAGKMALGYTELTYDIWAGYNDVYKTFDEAAEAVKSAIAGEVEPVRRAGFTIVESTLEMTAANHGLSISLEKATEAEKSYLRYLTLVDQAHSQGLVGTYAKELGTAEGLVRTLSQQMKSLAQAFGSLFLPILTRVIPYVQAFVEILTEAVHWLAALFGFKIQEVDWSGFGEGVGSLGESAGNAETALGGAAKAAKDLKKATLGIDELNVISPPTATGGGGSNKPNGGNGFAGLDVDSLWDESIFKDVQDNVDEIKRKLKEDILPLIGTVGAALALWKVANLLDDLDKATDIIKGLSAGLKIGAISILVGKLVWDFTGAYLEKGNWESFLSALGTTAIGSALAYYFGKKSGLKGAAGGGFGLVLTVSGVAMLGRLLFELSEGTVDFGDPQAWVTLLTGSLEAAIGTYFTWKTVKPVLEKYWPKIMTAITTAIGKITASGAAGGAGGAAGTAAGAAGGGAALATAGWVTAIVAYIAGWIAFGLADYDFTDIGKTIGTKIGEAFASLSDANEEIGKAIGTWINDSWETVSGYLEVDTLGEYLATIFTWETWRDKILVDFGKAIGDVWNSITQFFKDFETNFTENENELMSGIWTGFAEATGSDVDKVLKIAPEHFIMTPHQFFDWAFEVGEELLPGLWEGIESGWNTFWDENWKLWDKFVADVKEFFGIHSPSKKFEAIGKDLIAGLLKPFSLSALTDKIKKMWEDAKKWWNEKKGKLSTYTPTIGNIKSKVSSAWSTAKEWWSKKKGTLSTYTPSIGSIKSKLSSAWSTAKTWWTKKKGSMSYTPSIGSIKTKLQSAWNTAKSWWSKNVRLSIPSLSLKVTYDTKGLGTLKKAVVNALNLPGWPKLSFAANGGIFDMGSLIWAGERGAEVVANAGGGRTGVMNVNQMQEAVYEGVFAAMSAAMRSSGEGGGQPVNVYLDGRQILATVEQRQRERGANIMGKQVYSY